MIFLQLTAALAAGACATFLTEGNKVPFFLCTAGLVAVCFFGVNPQE